MRAGCLPFVLSQVAERVGASRAARRPKLRASSSQLTAAGEGSGSVVLSGAWTPVVTAVDSAA